MTATSLSVKGIVDQRVTMGSKSLQDDPIDETHEFTVKPLMVQPPPPYLLIIAIGIAALGVIYLVVRK